ncbi:DUF4249 domain-containing protein [Roseivirga pacifica]|uniref:DUF4249 domain-containing protein n=1 Tax=Roseivirga pacifica TaxID=1267423 RepID=UPI003BACE535
MRTIRQNKYFGIILFVVALIVTASCVEEFETDSIKYEKLMVVDANISDQVKAHSVRLFYTVPIDSEVSQGETAITGATVWVEDDQANRIDFTETSPGTYYSPSDFAGTPGRSYALFITTNDGKNYQSSFQELVSSPEITNIYNRYHVELGDGEATSNPGVQFFIDVENANQGSQFYRYEWVDTHQIIVPYPKEVEAVHNGQRYTVVPFDGDVEECYRETRFNELVLATSTNNDNGQLTEVPIKFSSAQDFDVTTKYAIQVTQRSISPEAYSYYRKIELFNESNGSLFDKQQGIIVGNITSLNDPEEEVLGFFEVSGASSKRVYLDLTDLDPAVSEYIFRVCQEYGALSFDGSIEDFYAALDVQEELRGTEVSRRSQFLIYKVGYTGEYMFSHRLCIDCTRRGSLGKPDYWELD